MLASPPITGEFWSLADWLEFRALCSEYGVCRINELLRISDEEQEEENSEFADQDSINEQTLENAIEEIDTRISSLGDSYPFMLESGSSILSINDEITKGGNVYLYCLFFSHAFNNNVVTADPPTDSSSRDIMQICSTLAAAGHAMGNAISFGFPRPDNTNFLNALQKTYIIIGDGIVRDTIPPGASENEKDGGIDIIAWRDSPDRATGHYYLLGQVASGHNWKGKSVKEYIKPFHETWFSQIPASQVTNAMFIPFCIDQKPSSNSHERHTLQDTIHHLTLRFGDLIYRYRLPLLVDKCFQLMEDNSSLHIDRETEFYKVIEYVENFRRELFPDTS